MGNLSGIVNYLRVKRINQKGNVPKKSL
jgi:hypothetical protein